VAVVLFISGCQFGNSVRNNVPNNYLDGCAPGQPLKGSWLNPHILADGMIEVFVPAGVFTMWC
jgi:hypothetical protein